MSERYLFGRVGPFALLMPAMQITHVSAADDGSGTPDDLVDLRQLFRIDGRPAGAQVRLAFGDGGSRTIELDQIGKLHAIAAAEFCALPPQLGYAATLFDAVCRRAIEGLYGLRLRRDPHFAAMPI